MTTDDAGKSAPAISPKTCEGGRAHARAVPGTV